MRWGNAKGYEVNELGEVLDKWQAPADGWSNVKALEYIASYADLMKRSGRTRIRMRDEITGPDTAAGRTAASTASTSMNFSQIIPSCATRPIRRSPPKVRSREKAYAISSL